jgi:peroxiredoxin
MKKLLFFAIVLFFTGNTHVFSQIQSPEIGKKTPEIKLPAPDGDTITLSSLKGKLVLIDFWATWCSPCLKEQPELVKLYNKYKQAVFTNGRGFEIYGVSLDSKRSSWEDIIKKVGISWIQVSDLKFWNSPVAKKYNIQELPFNLLIDGKGVVVAKNLHGAELEQKIAGYLTK